LTIEKIVNVFDWQKKKKTKREFVIAC